MLPGAFPTFPALVDPVAFVPSIAPVVAGVSTVDLTAAVAVLAWGLGGLIAFRLALSMSRKSSEPSSQSAHPALIDPNSGLRKAA